jgi:hypothetical protein
VNLHNRRVTYIAVPAQGYLGGAMGVAPPNKFTMAIDYVSPKMRDSAHPNQDDVYRFGVIAAR